MSADSAIAAFKAAAADARRWLFEEAAPLWCTAGRHPDGMFVEAFSPAGEPSQGDRRLRVQARQIFVFCELGRLGWDGPWRDAVAQAVDVLVARGQREDGFMIHRFGPDGQPSDRRADLYDSAFTLFALGHASQMLERPDLLAPAERLMAAIERDWTNPQGGFDEGEIDGPPRRQNPHMHLLEAMIVLWQATRDEAWADRARALATLGRDAFIEPATGALTEFFAPDWSRPDTDEGHAVEPGHCFEWAWLFAMLGKEGLFDPAPSPRLAAFGRAHGVVDGVAINVVKLDGSVVDAGARLWPQTERIKAAVTSLWHDPADTGAMAEATAAWQGLKRYFDVPVKGSYRDKLKPDGSWVEEAAPASSLYHITLGIAELIRAAELV
jgi:mannose/cellobiose epimerase-like protein (N-acyl-D-glucosamine 2-epimerase family)